MNAKEIFEQAISRQEQLTREIAVKFDDETQEEFDAKVERRINMVCVGLGHARNIPEINGICPGMEATWEGFRISRRRVDQLDNVYVSRARRE